VPVLAVFNVGSVATWVAARAVNQRGNSTLAVALLSFEVVAHAVLAVWLLGWQSGFHYYLIPLVPFLLFNDRLAAQNVVAASGLVVAVTLALRVVAGDAARVAVRTDLLEAIHLLNLLVPFGTLGALTYYFRLASIDAERRMETLAMTDALTTLPNRRRMLEMLEEQRVRVARSKASFGVLLGDIDGFKALNDRHGHECGDAVLREVSRLMRAQVRGQDVVARWGGEEFLVLLPDTDLDGAGVVAEKLRIAVESARIQFSGKELAITMTFGAASFDQDSTIDDCVRRADHALYQGKGQGKNRVVRTTSAPLPS
jgi:diguanylate cyclase (GGDEF)-like protein